MICKKCGHEIEENKKFCTHCGYSVQTPERINLVTDNLELQVLIKFVIMAIIIAIVFQFLG